MNTPQLIKVSIKSINIIPASTPSKVLYNFSVEEDESYIANNVVVHNCRCRSIPYAPESEGETGDFSQWIEN